MEKPHALRSSPRPHDHSSWDVPFETADLPNQLTQGRQPLMPAVGHPDVIPA